MNKQQILFPIGKGEEESGHKLVLPKIISNVSGFEMQFGMKQPTMNSAMKSKSGVEPVTLNYGKH